MTNAKAKGSSGEREFCEWLYKNFDLPKRPQRNLDQVRSGGADVIVPPFVFEVKRRESVDEYAFWNQVVIAADEYMEEHGWRPEPIVAYRQNRQPWRFIISGHWIGNSRGYIMLTERSFREWANNYINRWQGKPLENLDMRGAELIGNNINTASV